ncbi:hypothetical protein [Chryseobacterium indoltheticum]|uniref:hypothetical protein n=1 Tax=Chryseobacterium indoltheticum TaxID=254 RepID=UPI0028F1470E|nr:hypothetical protein [Chryseobacterium indoltheticum]
MSTNNTSAKPTPFTVGESSIGEGIINYKSTNNMNTNNNASQTLFRFVSLRNPQLTETKTDNLGFIHRPTDISSFFSNQVSETDSALAKFQSMERAAKSFTTALAKESQVESAFPEALKLGRKIAKREQLSDQDKNDSVTIYDSITKEQYESLWDNLMFQTVMQSDFYVKEAIIHVLKAIHLGYVRQLSPTEELKKINGEDLMAKAQEAKVVLPVRFFGDGTDNSGSTLVTNRSFTVGGSAVASDDAINAQQLPVAIQEQLKTEGEKISELSGISLEKQSLEKLKTELEKTQKAYYKIKNKAYETAYKEYLGKYQSEIDEYNRKLEEIEAKSTEETSEEEIRAWYAELGELNVPPFTFEYRDELNFEDFKAKLSLESLKLFVAIFTDANDKELDFSSINVISDRQLQLGEVIVSMNDEIDTYPEVFEELNERLSIQTQFLFERTSLNERVYANLGGVLIPVNNSANTLSNIIPRTYYLKANQQSGTNSYITFYYQAESNTWGTASAKIYAATDFGIYEETYSNISVSGNKVTFPSLLINKFGKVIRTLRIKIFFNNGEEANLEFSGLAMDEPYTGILYTERAKQEIENPSEPGTTPKPGTFIPKHFGVKRLGIADYLKVEQSIHAYVPGEVSNIENVMASELRHKSSVSRDYSEITDTTSESIETEKISDTTKTDRNEMQTEVAKEIDRQQSITASTNFSYNTGVYKFDIGGGYANNTAQLDSTRQAVTKSQEITERAMERVLTKINKERVQKIIKEYTETNVHEFDNRGKVTDTDNPDAAQPKHITGVYRWVDKKMKNQIYNYGKRTMFEFMIPEPAKLHRLAAFVNKETFKEPVDPRKAPRPNTMTDPKSATKDLLEYWANIYGITLSPLSELTKTYNVGRQDFRGNDGSILITIPTNYVAKSANIMFQHSRDKHGILGNKSQSLHFSNFNGGEFHSTSTKTYEPTSGSKSTGFFAVNITGQYNYTFRGDNLSGGNLAFNFNCELSQSFLEAWKQEGFDAIIKAYETAYADFLVKQKEADEKAKQQEAENKDKLSIFYRDMERVILKHNCIAYLLQDYLHVLGQNFTSGDQMKNFQVILGEELEQYAALAKFMEQAFEWEIMDYTFYPYYWASRDEWQKMYLTENADPLFRSFLQSGMARVIVTVKPGFEDAVQFFMTTGKIWNGGEVPVIGDPMYMSIVDEMRQPTGEAQGKFWISRIPTTLTILQAESVGLKVDPDQPLPIFIEEHPENCENPKELEGETSFNQIGYHLTEGKDTTTLPRELTTIINKK